MYGEPMKVQLGTICMNRTRKYLFPIIKFYGNDFTATINGLFKVAVGIGDIVVTKCGIHHEKHLFILCDTQVNTYAFTTSLNWIRESPAYEDDYAFDLVHKGRLHMIVIKVPDAYLDKLDKFKNGEFSKMYSKEEIRKLFTYTGRDKLQKETYDDINKVLIHDHNYKMKFAKQIEKEFNIPKFSPNEIENDQEFELPILTQEEFFNLNSNE